MDTFTNKLNESNKPLPKFNDKTKQELYSLIEENVKINVEEADDESTDKNMSLSGVDELTDKLYNYIQKEKIKGEINVLESIKSILVAGPFNLMKLDEQIQILKERL